MSETPHETEEEEERNEEDSGDDPDDVEKILNEDDESDRRRGPRGAGVCVETETTRNLKGKNASRTWTTVEISSKPCNTEVSRRS